VQEHVAATLGGSLLGLRSDVGGHDRERDVAGADVGLELARRRKPVEVGHVGVEHDRGRSIEHDPSQPLARRGVRHHVVAPIPAQLREDLPAVGVVVDDQDQGPLDVVHCSQITMHGRSAPASRRRPRRRLR
jgi:hypothetical protein